jgi:hypothetical protein
VPGEKATENLRIVGRPVAELRKLVNHDNRELDVRPFPGPIGNVKLSTFLFSFLFFIVNPVNWFAIPSQQVLVNANRHFVSPCQVTSLYTNDASRSSFIVEKGKNLFRELF